MKKAFSILLLLPIVLMFQNCDEALVSRGITSNPSLDETLPSENDESDPNPVNFKTVTLGFGTGGVNFLYDNESDQVINKSADLDDQYSNISAPACMHPDAILLNGRCCLGDRYNCFGGTGHSDYLYRGVAYGDGKFIAVGGWTHGIIKTSLDGVNWSDKIDLHSDLNNVQGGVRNRSNWLGGVAYGMGRFSVVSGPGYLFYSSDGSTWTSTSGDGSSEALRQIIFTGNGFLAVGDNGAWAFSPDGIEWSESGFLPQDQDGFQPSIWVVKNKDNVVYGSARPADGITRVFKMDTLNLAQGWTEVSSVPRSNYNIVLDTDTLNLYSFGFSKTHISTDEGLTWQENDSNHAASPSTVSYHAGVFTSVRARNNTIEIYTSLDGLDWTLVVDSERPQQNQQIRSLISVSVPEN